MKKLLQRPGFISQFISTYSQSLVKDMTRPEGTQKGPFLFIYLSLGPHSQSYHFNSEAH